MLLRVQFAGLNEMKDFQTASRKQAGIPARNLSPKFSIGEIREGLVVFQSQIKKWTNR
jgi:hypothetical protein